MKKVKLLCSMGIACLMICAICPALFAQDVPVAEVFGGFSYAKLGDGGGNMSGLGLSGAYNFTDKLAAKVDIDALFAGVKDCNDCSAKQFNILGGVQYSVMRTDSLNVFAEGLVGLSRFSLKTPVINIPGFGIVPDYSIGGDTSNSNFAMALGGGVDWKFSEKYAWRVAQVDYMRVFSDGGGGNEFRFKTGILISLGSR